MISIIIPLFNKGNKICRTIESVIHQDYDDYEIIVIDDGSTDDSALYVKDYEYDEHLKYYKKENGGVSSARNFGVSIASGDWLIFLDADDELAENALLTFSRLSISYPDCCFFVGNTRWIQHGKTFSRKHKKKKTRSFSTIFPFFSIWCNKFYPATRNMMIHRKLYERFGGFDCRMSFYEDWDFSLRMAECGYVVFVNSDIGIYRQDGNGLSGTNHSFEKDMAYYIPEMLKEASFWKKALLYDNIEQTIVFWNNNQEIVSFYKQMQNDYFGIIYYIVHFMRQKLSSFAII